MRKKEYNTHYEVYEDGRVWSKRRNRFLAQSERNDKGYLRVTIDNKSINVHKLVAECFIGNCEDGFVVDHIDHDRKNNHVSNLQIIPMRKNCSKTNREKTSKYIGVSLHKRTGRWRARAGDKYLGLFRNPKVAAAVYQREIENG